MATLPDAHHGMTPVCDPESQAAEVDEGAVRLYQSMLVLDFLATQIARSAVMSSGSADVEHCVYGASSAMASARSLLERDFAGTPTQDVFERCLVSSARQMPAGRKASLFYAMEMLEALGWPILPGRHAIDGARVYSGG